MVPKKIPGYITVVGERLQEEFACAILVHCLAHYINLCLQEVAHKVKSIKEGSCFAMDVIQLIVSPKRSYSGECAKTTGIRSWF